MTRLYRGFRVAVRSQRLYRHGRRELRSFLPARRDEDVLTDFNVGEAFSRPPTPLI
jgi:hypothetical protein